MTYLQGCGYGQQDGGPLQLLVQRGDHVARVRDLPQQPAEVAAGEVVQEPALALQGPRTRGSKQVDNIDVGAEQMIAILLNIIYLALPDLRRRAFGRLSAPRTAQTAEPARKLTRFWPTWMRILLTSRTPE